MILFGRGNLKKYNKAIRDKIPEIIQKDGHTCNTKTLSDEQFLIEIEKKLSEEVTEFQNDKNPEELADILEVIYRIAELRGISKDELEVIRTEKAEKRGSFQKNLFLIDTEKSVP
jgi:predicted house-cleaning noncanonical NTP pyrophosphatase (MazG superfamily)